MKKLRYLLNSERLLLTPGVDDYIFTKDTRMLYYGNGITPGGENVLETAITPIINDKVADIIDVKMSSYTNIIDAKISNHNKTINAKVLNYDNIIDAKISNALKNNVISKNLDLRSYNIVGTGNINISGDIISSTIKTGKTVITSNGLVSNEFFMGSVQSPLELTLNLSENLTINQVITPLSGSGYLVMNQCRGSLNSPQAAEAGDELGGILFKARTSSSKLAVAGFISFVVDDTAVIADGNYIKSKIALAASTDTSQDSENAFILDSAGIATSNAFVASKYTQLAVYADDASRTLAIPNPAKGMMILMTSGTSPSVTNKVVFYDGSNWVALN